MLLCLVTIREALEVIAKQMGNPSAWKEDNRSNVEKQKWKGYGLKKALGHKE